MDAATQVVMQLPHFKQDDKLTIDAKRIPMHLMACLCHGRGAFCYAFTYNMKHGANVTIEILHRVLQNVWKKDGKLPRTFYLQLDNTSKQCKNRYVLGFLGLLVEWGLVDTIILSFLPVGHTHEDIGACIFVFFYTIAF